MQVRRHNRRFRRLRYRIIYVTKYATPKCHTCYAKYSGVNCTNLRCQASSDPHAGTESTPATQIESATPIGPEVLKVRPLPRKMQRPQFDPPSPPNFRRHLCTGTENGALATQIQPATGFRGHLCGVAVVVVVVVGGGGGGYWRKGGGRRSRGCSNKNKNPRTQCGE